MSTISADVTKQMVNWAEEQVKKGLYKSKSELIREMFREKMGKGTEEEWKLFALKKAVEDWDNADELFKF